MELAKVILKRIINKTLFFKKILVNLRKISIINKLLNYTFIKRALEKQDEIYLEVGCGSSPKPGYLHCDIRPLYGVEVVCEACEIPFPKNTVTKIYSRHMLEHLSQDKAMPTLKHWFNILRVEGELDLNVPDLEKTIEQLRLPGKSPYIDVEISNHLHAMYSLFGWQNNPFDFHKWSYTFKSLSELLHFVGFEKIKRTNDLESKSGPLNLRIIAKKLKES